ncbi:MAG: zinc ribbon domain-containing protein [Candidatus Hodarchaeota archaeon]
MGWGRVIKSGIVGMVILVPMAYISFRFLNLTEGVTGGLIENVDEAVSSLSSFLGLGGAFIIELIAGILIGLLLIFIFPIHWCLFYRPEDIGLLVAVTLPWILSCVIASALFAHSPREAIHTNLSMGIGYAIVLSVIYLILAIAIPFGIGPAIIDGILIGLTDLPYLLAVLTAVFEGCLVGTVFGAFIGSLRYKPKGVKKKKHKVKVKEEPEEPSEMFPRETVEEEVVGTPTSVACSNCGAKLTEEDLFCTNCGAKKP